MKAAMLSFSRLVADLHAKDGIRCNAITPGPTATPAWLAEGGLADQQGDRDEILAKVGSGTAAPGASRRPPDEIASVIVFLCSGAGELRHRSRLERRRRHRADHHLGDPNQRRSTRAGALETAYASSIAATGAATTLSRWHLPDGSRTDSPRGSAGGLEDDALSPLLRCARTNARPARPEQESDVCSLRTPFQRDRDRIVHCKAFRRLKHKTQVFIAPEGDHYRTRLTHTLEVSAISRGVARALRLNEDLTEAIALGHDLGHTPFGHAGEEALDAALRARYGRRLPAQRAVAARRRGARARRRGPEPDRRGARRHPAPHGRRTPGDARGPDRAHRRPRRLHEPRHRRRAPRRHPRSRPTCPGAAIALLGTTGSQRIDALVHDLVETSEAAGDIAQIGRLRGRDAGLRAYMFEHVYRGGARAEAERAALRSAHAVRALCSPTPTASRTTRSRRA